MPDPSGFDPLFALTADDVEVLRSIITERRSSGDRQPGRRGPQFDRTQTPEVYLAKAPAGGIPAKDAAGTTGTGTTSILDDLPGSAECEIYLVDRTSATPGFLRHGDVTRTVYNVSATAVEANTWFLVHRDKFGTWFASSGGRGSDAELETFTASFSALTSVAMGECGLSFTTGTYLVTVKLPVGATFTIEPTGTTGTGDDVVTEINFDDLTRPVTVLTSVTAAIDPVTCAITFTNTSEEICVWSTRCCIGTAS